METVKIKMLFCSVSVMFRCRWSFSVDYSNMLHNIRTGGCSTVKTRQWAHEWMKTLVLYWCVCGFMWVCVCVHHVNCRHGDRSQRVEGSSCLENEVNWIIYCLIMLCLHRFDALTYSQTQWCCHILHVCTFTLSGFRLFFDTWRRCDSSRQIPSKIFEFNADFFSFAQEYN